MSLFRFSLNRRQQVEVGLERPVEILIAPVDGHVSGATLTAQNPFAVSGNNQAIERRATTRRRISLTDHTDQYAVHSIAINVTDRECSTPDIQVRGIRRIEVREE